MSDPHDKNEDRRPEIAQDDDKKSPTDTKEKWHNPEATIGEAPASDPNAEKRSRVSDN